MKRTLIFLFFLGVGIVLFVSVIANTGIDSIMKSLEKFSLLGFIILIALSMVNFGLFTLRWDIILHHHHTKSRIPFYRLFLHRMAGYAVNYLTPSMQTGSEPLRIYFLQEDGVDTKDAVSSCVIDKVFEYTALIFFIFSGVGVSLLDGSIFSDKTEIILGVMIVLFAVLIFWFYYATIKKIGFFSSIFRLLRLNKIKRIAHYENGIIHVENQMAQFYTHHIRKFLILLALSFVTVFFMVLEHYLVARFMGVKLSFFQSFLSATIPGFSYLLPIPGALGALEGSHAAIFTILGVTINVFVFVLILRLRDIIFILIGLAHASSHGIQMIFKSFKDKQKG
jgi:glycosyltransferase 2 family protein